MTVATLRSVAALKAAGLVSDALAPNLAAVEAAYAIALPEPLARVINPADPADAIRRRAALGSAPQRAVIMAMMSGCS